MPHRTQDIALTHGTPGTSRTLRVHRFGPEDAAGNVYIQAGLHAGEIPGMLVARHLLDRLTVLEDQGAVRDGITLVPMANPIGRDQMLLGSQIGRFDLAGGSNFNRAFPDLSASVAAAVRGRLGADPAGNTAVIRRALRQALTDHPAGDALSGLRRQLMLLAADADVVLDLHCDSESVMHLYTAPALWPGLADLAARLGCRHAFLADDSGGEPFDDACSALWWRLRTLLGPDHPIPAACAATTIELRGLADVDDATAAADADAIIGFLTARGSLAGRAPAAGGSACTATPLAGVDMVKAPVAGIILYRVALGDQVAAGDLVAEILDPLTGQRTRCHTRTAGPVWSRNHNRFAHAGDVLVKVAGDQPLPDRKGQLLTAR